MLNKKKPICFISYCRDGADIDSITHLVQQLKDISRHKVDFLFDEDLNAGSKLGSFMELLRIVDGVIILLSPEYNAKVKDRVGGVYKEYSEIIRRYQELELAANLEVATSSDAIVQAIAPPFPLIPLIFSGQFDKSCPDDIRQNLCKDFTSYKAHRRENDGTLYITHQVASKYNKPLSKIISQIVVSNSSRSEEVAASFDELLASFFENTKHEHLSGDPKFESEIEQVFVKTYAFKKVKKQTSYLLVGRKGSGKSTIVDYLSRDVDEKYKETIKINVNNFDLEFLYSILSSQQIRSELGIVIPQVKIFEVVWELFLYLTCINCVVTEYKKGLIKPIQQQFLPVISNFLFNLTATKGTAGNLLDYRAGFHWCYTKIVEQIDFAIKNARNGAAEFSYDISRLLASEDMLRAALTSKVYDAFNALIGHCTKRFLISLDGFDTAFEEFRIRSQESIESEENSSLRTQYEIDWLRGFAHVLIEMKSSPRRTLLSNLADFCATIPKDRYVEIRNCERDSYIYIGKCHEIRWSGIELAILLYKRLEILANYKTRQDKSPQERLEEVLSVHFPYIPMETSSLIDEKEYSMAIFTNVLRHTFWRPREILIYFAKIIAVLRHIRKRHIEVTQFAVNKCISDTTREIIKTEFLSEFQRHCLNLREIIEQFRQQKRILSMEEIISRIGNIGFKFIDQKKPILDMKLKLKFLYEVGFLGLEANSRAIQRLKLLGSDIFWFNAGDEPFEFISNEGFQDCRFIIHPVFCEFLDLETQKQRLPLHLDWHYLQQQEVHVIAPS